MAGNVVLPFFGADVLPWVRPALTTFSTWLNQSGLSTNADLANTDGATGGHVVAMGSGYVPGDTITLAGGTGTPAVLALVWTQVATAVVNGVGSGGTPGQVVISGTTGVSDFDDRFSALATINGAGHLASIDEIYSRGTYSVNPTSLTVEPVTGGGLTGATVTLTMGANLATVSDHGNYSVAPTNPVAQASSSGAGTGATWMLYCSVTPATITDGANGAPIALEMVAGSEANPYCVTGKLKSIGAPPWTITAGIAGVNVGQGSVFGPILYNSTSKKAIAFHWYATNLLKIFYIVNADNPVLSNRVRENVLPVVELAPYFIWFRIQHDGTNLIYSISFNNSVFLEAWREKATSYLSSIDKVGWGAFRDLNGPGGVMLVDLWSWVET
jgi:hypothetical protein